MHRVFIALPISEKLKKKVLKFQKDYSALPVRWLQPDNVHITIVPPWEVKDTKDLKKVFKEFEGNIKCLKDLSSIDIKYKLIRFGPDPKRPRLIWAEGNSLEILPKLKKELTKKLGLELEKRPFKLHITLARFSQSDFKDFPQKRIRQTTNWTDSINSICLLESKLTKQGARYKKLAEIKF